VVSSQTIRKIIELNGGRLGIVTGSNGADGFKPGLNGIIFSIKKDGTDYSPIYYPKNGDGSTPVDMIQSMDGWIFVASQTGGEGGHGIIYKVRADGSSYT